MVKLDELKDCDVEMYEIVKNGGGAKGGEGEDAPEAGGDDAGDGGDDDDE